MPASDRRRLLALLAAGSALTALPLRHARAAAWPSRPVRLVVPFPAGGGTDIAARLLAERLAPRLGQPVVVENKPGASTILGVQQVVDAEPDGHVLLLSGSTSYTVNPAVRPRLPYDPFRQLTPLALVARAPLVLLAQAAGPHATLGALLDAAARQPGVLNYATFGPGTGPHLVTELVARARGVQLTAVPYKGSGEALLALVRGDVALGVDTLAAAAPQLRAGKLRALAVVAAQRSPLLPGVPGYAELGLLDALFEGWYALAGPAGLPAAVQDTLLQHLRVVLAEPGLRERMAQQSLEATLLEPAALRALMDREVVRYRALAARTGIRLD